MSSESSFSYGDGSIRTFLITETCVDISCVLGVFLCPEGNVDGWSTGGVGSKALSFSLFPSYELRRLASAHTYSIFRINPSPSSSAL